MASGSRDLHRPIPPLPDLKEYQHLTERERMNAGYPYKPSDPELCAGRDNAKKLCQEFNTSKWDDRKRRREILRELFNPACANNQIAIIPTFRCDYGYNITIGNNVEFNYDCCILDCAPIEIGNNVLFAPSVHLYAATHPIDPKYRMSGENYCELAYPIKIGDNVWIGGHSVVNPGVTIGDNVVVGAGSVVTKDVPSNVVVAGNPAKIIRILDLSEPPEFYKQISKPQGEGSRNVE